jgi:3-hydroxyacyl-[acyl-carrier-protein] dehydratase
VVTMMRFCLLDQITHLDPSGSITAVKRLDPQEDYLSDHFPNFPCMPGVLMLEAMYQAGAWLLRERDDFTRPIVMLKEARNVKYGNFVEPNHVLTVTVNLMSQVDEHCWKVKGNGTVDGKPAVSGVLVLDQFRLAERHPARTPMDAVPRREYLKVFRRLYNPPAKD